LGGMAAYIIIWYMYMCTHIQYMYQINTNKTHNTLHGPSNLCVHAPIHYMEQIIILWYIC